MFHNNMGFEFFNMGFDMDLISLEIELILGDISLQKQSIQQPYMMAQAQCKDLIVQIAEDERPMKVIIRGSKPIEMPNGDWVQKPSSLEFKNNAYIRNFSEGEN